MKTFTITEQVNKIQKILRKKIKKRFVSISVHVTVGGDWDTHPIIVDLHKYGDFHKKKTLVITAFSTQDKSLSSLQRWEAPDVEGIEMRYPEGSTNKAELKSYALIKKHFGKEGFAVYDHWKDFYN